MKESIPLIDQEAEERYSRHKDLAANELQARWQTHFKNKRVLITESNRLSGNTEQPFHPKSLRHFELDAEATRQEAEHETVAMEVDAKHTSEWASQNQDALIESAKLSAQAAGVDIKIVENQHQIKSPAN